MSSAPERIGTTTFLKLITGEEDLDAGTIRSGRRSRPTVSAPRARPGADRLRGDLGRQDEIGTARICSAAATRILAFEGNSEVVWFAGNDAVYEADRRRRRPGGPSNRTASRSATETLPACAGVGAGVPSGTRAEGRCGGSALARGNRTRLLRIVRSELTLSHAHRA